MATFGFTDIGASWLSANGPAQAVGAKATLSEPGTITSISAYLGKDSGAGDCKFILTNAAGDILGQTNTVALSGTYGWVTLDLITPYVAAAGDYVLLFWTTGTAAYTKYTTDTGMGRCTSGDISAQWSTATSITVVTNVDYKASIYATYTADGPTYQEEEANFGYETIGATWHQYAGSVVGSLFTLPSDALVESITAYVGGAVGNVEFAIYDAAGNHKGHTASVALGAYAWVKADLLTPVALEAGDYILCSNSDSF
jgi:hypothetical protein